MTTIKDITAMEIIDSRGQPTVKVHLTLTSGIAVTAAAPSGASKGKFEALELRDNDEKRYHGQGVLQAIANITQIIGPKLRGMDPVKQGAVDMAMIELDGTDNKAKLGANAILAVSIAVCKAAARAVGLPLYSYINELAWGGKPQVLTRVPTPIFNLINGGLHGSGRLDFQEFHVIPATIKPYPEALRLGVELYQQLKTVLIGRNSVHAVGDEGGFTPTLFTNYDAIATLVETVRQMNYKYGFDVFFGLDLAASQFKKDDAYHVKDRPVSLSTEEFIDFLSSLQKEFHLLLFEDPIAEDDWEGWKKCMDRFSKDMLIVGDDLIVTNLARLKKAIAEQACSAIIIKPNQIGTVSETLLVVQQAKQSNIKIIVSHRSGETNDTFIADFAVGVAADYAKFGAPARGERTSKYNRLLEISHELNIH